MKGKEKQLEVRIARNVGSIYEIKYAGGGQVPDNLSGYYTKRVDAQRAIDTYVPARPKKKVKQNEQTNG